LQISSWWNDKMVEQIKENYTSFFLGKKENFTIFLAVGFPSLH